MPLSYDLHVHSEASVDCETRLKSLARIAIRRKLSGIAITDHDTMEGVNQLWDRWPHNKLHLIRGCERTLFDGSHLIGLFLTHVPKTNTVREVISEIREQGGLVYLPHPYRKYSGALGATSEIHEAEREYLLEQAEIIEIFNAKCTDEENQRGLALLDRYPRSFAAASDSHFEFKVGYAYTMFDVPLSPSAFVSTAAFAPDVSTSPGITLGMYEPPESRKRVLLKRGLDYLGLLSVAKSVNGYLRSRKRPHLTKYK